MLMYQQEHAAGAAGEQDREALPHARFLQPLLHARELRGLQQGAEPLHLLRDLPVVEQLPRLDGLGRDEIPVLDDLGLGERHFREEGLLDVVGEGETVHILEPLVAAEGDEARGLERGLAVGDGAADALVVLHVVGDCEQSVDREGLLAVRHVPVAQQEEEPLRTLSGRTPGAGCPR